MRTFRFIAVGGGVLLLLSCSDRATAPKPLKHDVKASEECSSVVIRVGNQIDTLWTCPQ